MSVLLPLSSCPSSLLILSFFLCPLVLPPLSFPSSSVLWSSSQFPLVVLVLFLLPPILFFCGIPDSYRGCCRIPTGFLQAFVYRVPTGFLWVPIGFLHNSYRVPMGFLQGSYRVIMGFLQAFLGSYRIPSQFLQGPYGVPTGFLQFLPLIFVVILPVSSCPSSFSYFVLFPLLYCPSSSVLLSFFLCPVGIL